MRIGVPKEIKNNEYRVGLTPASVCELVDCGHKVYVESGAGEKIGFNDDSFRLVGGVVLDTPEEVFSTSDMIVKVKEPQESEFSLLREDQILFTYLHLAADLKLAKKLQEIGCVAIAYETVTSPDGSLPLLSPMSEVAGRMSVQAGAASLEVSRGGRGCLLGGVPGVAPAKVVIFGGGVVGSNAAQIAVGMGADVTVIDKSLKKLHELEYRFGSRISTVYSTTETVKNHIKKSDLLIGAVLIPGDSAPCLVSKEMLADMKDGSVMVDVSIDQGGCFATSRPTTHQNPTYIVDGVVHYCVANIPGAVPRTSTFALNNATLPYVKSLANYGFKEAFRKFPDFINGLNVCCGKFTYKAVAKALNQEYIQADSIINS